MSDPDVFDAMTLAELVKRQSESDALVLELASKVDGLGLVDDAIMRKLDAAQEGLTTRLDELSQLAGAAHVASNPVALKRIEGELKALTERADAIAEALALDHPGMTQHPLFDDEEAPGDARTRPANGLDVKLIRADLDALHAHAKRVDDRLGLILEVVAIVALCAGAYYALKQGRELWAQLGHLRGSL